CYVSNSVYQWSFAAPGVSVEPIEPNIARSALLSVDPSPARGAQTFAFRIASGDAPRALEVFSVDGRRVWQESLLARAAGVQTLSWSGRPTDGKPAAAAVYFARLVTARATSTRRFVRL